MVGIFERDDLLFFAAFRNSSNICTANFSATSTAVEPSSEKKYMAQWCGYDLA